MDTEYSDYQKIWNKKEAGAIQPGSRATSLIHSEGNLLPSVQGMVARGILMRCARNPIEERYFIGRDGERG